MRFANQYRTASEPAAWHLDAHGGSEPLLAAADATAEFYRREAQRLLGLAASSPVDEVRRQFLGLAQQYEALAEHAARRSRRGV